MKVSFLKITMNCYDYIKIVKMMQPTDDGAIFNLNALQHFKKSM